MTNLTDHIERLFREFDSGCITRRDLLKALGVSAIAPPALARGQGGATQAAPAQAPAPFEPTGWQTVWLDHITYQCTDAQKAAAFFSAVMSWKVRSADSRKIVMDIGDDVG